MLLHYPWVYMYRSTQLTHPYQDHPLRHNRRRPDHHLDYRHAHSHRSATAPPRCRPPLQLHPARPLHRGYHRDGAESLRGAEHLGAVLDVCAEHAAVWAVGKYAGVVAAE